MSAWYAWPLSRRLWLHVVDQPQLLARLRAGGREGGDLPSTTTSHSSARIFASATGADYCGSRDAYARRIEQLRTGLWTWTAPHPEWHEQPVVRSYAVERDSRLVLIDPIAPPEELVAGRELEIALTCPWHTRDAPTLGAPEVELDSRPGFYGEERVLWLPEHGALVFGDAFPGGAIPDEWLPEDRTREDYRSWLASLLELPVELVLPTHGEHGGPDLLEQALR